MQKILLKAARTCLGPKSSRWSTSQLLQGMNWMGFSQMSEYVTSQIIHQVVTTDKPIFLKSKIHHPLKGNTRAAKNGNLSIPNHASKRFSLSISVRGTSRYNQIPSAIKNIKNKKIFKKKLKNLIITKRSFFIQDMSKNLKPILMITSMTSPALAPLALLNPWMLVTPPPCASWLALCTAPALCPWGQTGSLTETTAPDGWTGRIMMHAMDI